MSSRWLGGLLVVLAGCTCQGEGHVESGVADPASFAKELAACATGECKPLRIRLFDLSPDDEIEMCQVAGVDAAGNSHVITRYVDTSVCASDDGGYIGTDDGTVDDSSGDDSGDDGSTDEGSSDDGSSDSGDAGDDGSTDRRAPAHTPKQATISDMPVTKGL